METERPIFPLLRNRQKPHVLEESDLITESSRGFLFGTGVSFPLFFLYQLKEFGINRGGKIFKNSIGPAVQMGRIFKVLKTGGYFATFKAVTYMAAKLREKEDPWNAFAGGFAVGAIKGILINNFKKAAFFGMLGGSLTGLLYFSDSGVLSGRDGYDFNFWEVDLIFDVYRYIYGFY
jgi:hypothetical protein